MFEVRAMRVIGTENEFYDLSAICPKCGEMMDNSKMADIFVGTDEKPIKLVIPFNPPKFPPIN